MNTPPEIILALREYSSEVLSMCKELPKSIKGKAKTLEEKEFNATLNDRKALAYPGLYYADKFSAAVDLRIYNETKDEKYHESSLGYIKQACEDRKNYLSVFSNQYYLTKARNCYMDPEACLENVEKDIQIVQNRKCRKLN